MGRHRIIWACLALVACVGKVDQQAALPAGPVSDMAREIDQLRVLSYNVKGLPWPIARGRDTALESIGRELARMRQSGEQPHILVLQEAFVEQAKRIGPMAGYRYAAFGPAPSEAAADAGAVSRAYARGANWLKGETFAPVMDSGLALFSDYPIERVERLTFPQGACAGFDCLAAKGMLIAWIRLPGAAEPVAVATTHLNSLRASGVPLPRANMAFSWQFARVREFAGARIGDGRPAIFAGDFNLGGDTQRIATAGRIGLPLAHARDALGDALASRNVAAEHLDEARAVRRKRTDQQLYRSGGDLSLRPVGVEIPFPETGTESPLSDHPGLMIRYALSANS